MRKIWKDIAGYEGKYQVSNSGEIMSLHYGNTNTPKVMKPSLSSTGYFIIQLYCQRKSKTFLVHKLVADAFLQKPPYAEEINHKDGNKQNNSVDNLEWVTKSANQKHAIKNGLRAPSPMTGRTGKLSPKSKSVLQYDLNGRFIKKWWSISDAAREYKTTPSSIIGCLSGRSQSSCGYIWKYDYKR